MSKPAANATEEPAKPAKKKPLPLIIGVIVIVIALVVGKSVLGGSHKDKAKEKKKAPTEVGISLPLDEFLVNLSGGGEHYLRATIALGMEKGVTEEQAKEKIAPMRDSILGILSAQTLPQLVKPQTRETLKDQIKKKINEETGEEHVVKVYFTSFATQ